ncbi:MAG: PepSY-associated TM helix domain-containing protein [Gammaproteobacteria bacterium]
MLKNKRPLWLKIHAYLALIFGFWIALLGLAGSFCIYGDDLDRLVNPQLSVARPGNAYQPLERILAAVRAAHPQRHGSWTLELPRSPDDTLTAWYERPGETSGKFYAPLMVSVNPYTAEVVASRFWGDTAATWLSDLHTQLLLGQFGWYAVGCLGLTLLVSLLSGLYLWWPGFGGLLRSFSLRHTAGAGLLAMDIHRLLGVGSAAILLFLAFTGFSLSFPTLSETLIGTSGMGHGDDGPEVRSSAQPNDRPVSLDAAVRLARGPFPHAELRRVATPAGPADTYRVFLRQSEEINRKHPFTTVWVDRYSGHIRAVRNPIRFSDGERMLERLWPMHTGEALGTWGRIAWFAAGLMPAILYVTGLLRWLISRGWVKDFPVDFTPLRRVRDWTTIKSAQLGRFSYRILQRYAAKAAVRMEMLALKGRRYYQELCEKREPWW